MASEAQINGLPVIASMRGGLPESVGSGGILIEKYDSVDHWDRALKSLWQNVGLYNELKGNALQHAGRELMQEEKNVSQLIKYAESVIV